LSARYQVIASRTIHDGRVISLRTDHVRMPGGAVVERDVVEHPGAVMIVALDDSGGVLLVSQYRHPVGGFLLELPAGLLDKERESPVDAARRELFEEAGLRAAAWHTLLDLRISPGGMNEIGRVYLARDLTPVPEGERFYLGQGGEYEEADLRAEWVDLDDAVRRALAGEIQNGTTVAGLLAAAHTRDRNWRSLRPADAPWPPHHVRA
jgi:8-oxo-dGDP phosphatase